ncbi:MAG: metallophosphoesterase [Abditibacteriota bacterium]|nr:metallophosphoesterase [Abditibacteriota bacterium]
MKKLFLAIALILTATGILAAGLTFEADRLYTQGKALDRVPHTYEAWVRLPRDYAPRGGIIAGNYGITCANNFEIGGRGVPRLFIDGEKLQTADIQFSALNAATGLPVHVAIVLDTEAGRADCYLNGRLAESKEEVKINNQDKPLAGFEPRLPTLPLVIGGDRRIGNMVKFAGSILSVAEFSTLRTPAEIRRDMYGLDPADPGLIFCYDLKKAAARGPIEDLAGNYPLDYIANPYYIDESERWVEPDKVDNSQIAYSMAFLGDTQVVNDSYPEKLRLLFDWILAQKDELNIRYVMGLGDITNRNLPREWELAAEQYNRLNGIIDWGVVIGNHDGSKEYNAAFDTPAYRASCAGFFEEGKIDNSYRFLTVGDNKYIIFTMEYGPRDEVMEWAGKLIDEYPECKAIVTTHCYLFRDGTTLDEGDVCPPTLGGRPNNGDHMWDKFVRKHKTIQFVINGHDPFDMVVAAQEKGDHGNLVTQMLIDPQGTDASLHGACLVCILGFSEDGKHLYVRYYSCDKQQYYMKNNQYELDLE